MTSVFDGMEGADPTQQGGNYLKDGKHTIEVVKVELKNSRSGVQFYIVEGKVVETDSDHKNMKPGRTITWMVKMTLDSALNNIKNFLCATTGADSDEIGKQEAMDSVAPEQPLAGVFVKCEATEITTKAGKPFTKVVWEEFETEGSEA